MIAIATWTRNSLKMIKFDRPAPPAMGEIYIVGSRIRVKIVVTIQADQDSCLWAWLAIGGA